MKTQTIVIHGGDTFNTYEEFLEFTKNFPLDFERYKQGLPDWKESLKPDLDERFEVIRPRMPNERNAKYLEWKIWFEKFVPHFESEVILIGHSLGGTFLAKYLAEEKFPKKVKALFLVAPCFDDKDADYSLADFQLPDNLNKITEQADKIYLYHSSDDQVVPFADLNKFKKALPSATVREFKDRGHFNQEHFPEIVEDIKKSS